MFTLKGVHEPRGEAGFGSFGQCGHAHPPGKECIDGAETIKGATRLQKRASTSGRRTYRHSGLSLRENSNTVRARYPRHFGKTLLACLARKPAFRFYGRGGTSCALGFLCRSWAVWHRRILAHGTPCKLLRFSARVRSVWWIVPVEAKLAEQATDRALSWFGGCVARLAERTAEVPIGRLQIHQTWKSFALLTAFLLKKLLKSPQLPDKRGFLRIARHVHVRGGIVIFRRGAASGRIGHGAIPAAKREALPLCF